MNLLFVILYRWKRKPTKEMRTEIHRLRNEITEKGVKILGDYVTLGRYDGVIIAEGPDEKVVLKGLFMISDFFSTETLVATTAGEFAKLAELV